MYEAAMLVGIGAAAALGGFLIGDRITRAEPYVPAHKRTEKDVKKTEKKLDKHFSVINIESDVDHIVNDMDPEQEHPFGEPAHNAVDKFEYEASVVEPKPSSKSKPQRCAVCNVLAKRVPYTDDKYYCKKHHPGLQE